MNSQGHSQGLPHSLGQPETRQETHYNVVYQHLVVNDTDIVGQLAYCLYKQSKQKYLREFQRLNGRRPTDAELRIHVNCAELPALDDYRDKATQVMAEVLAQAAQEKQDTLEKHFKNQLWEFINRHQPETLAERGWRGFKGLLFGGAGGVVGNVFTTLLVLLVLFGAASSATQDEFTKRAKENLVSGLAKVIGISVSINGNDKLPLPEGPIAERTE
ncbi:hypothetical protein [Pseudomonas alabamensis]|uniref:hypothetical protein n=1 Tax=Pseudomonas alabamensis TaxID=3064349 RepID=UPI003F64D0BB